MGIDKKAIRSYKETAYKVPSVSIGMPVYNGQIYIAAAIDSILGQTFTDFELIISDNASSDRTREICQEYADRDRRIRYVRQRENIGPLANFQFLINEAVGEYFMWAAADDVQCSGLIEALDQVMRLDKGIVTAITDIGIIDNKGQIKRTEILIGARRIESKKGWEKARNKFLRMPYSNLYYCIYGLHRLDVLKSCDLDCNGRLNFLFGSEAPLLAQLSLRGEIVSIPEVLKYYRVHSDSVAQSARISSGFCGRVYDSWSLLVLLREIIHSSKLARSQRISLIIGLYIQIIKRSFGILLDVFLYKNIRRIASRNK